VSYGQLHKPATGKLGEVSRGVGRPRLESAPSVHVVYRILFTLASHGGTLAPTALQCYSRTGYGQFQRYCRVMKTWGLISIREGSGQRRRIVCLEPSGYSKLRESTAWMFKLPSTSASVR
jgi:hypothetical protein